MNTMFLPCTLEFGYYGIPRDQIKTPKRTFLLDVPGCHGRNIIHVDYLNYYHERYRSSVLLQLNRGNNLGQKTLQ